MIGRISGKLIARHPPQVIVDVQGLGHELDVPLRPFYPRPAPALSRSNRPAALGLPLVHTRANAGLNGAVPVRAGPGGGAAAVLPMPVGRRSRVGG